MVKRNIKLYLIELNRSFGSDIKQLVLEDSLTSSIKGLLERRDTRFVKFYPFRCVNKSGMFFGARTRMYRRIHNKVRVDNLTVGLVRITSVNRIRTI